ncbi:MAG: hypothetical protein Crog4KO_26480 [Crocinitomicaceae bacterium]
MIIPLVLFSVIGLAFIVLGTMLNKKSSTGNREANKLFVAIMRSFGVVVLVVGIAYAVFNNNGWTTEDTRTFLMLALLAPVIMFVMIGVRFIRLNARGIGKTSALAWIVLWLGIGGFGLMKINNYGQGWTEESKKKITDKVTPYDRMCYLEQIMEMYDSPAEYNKMVTKDEEKIAKRMEENCRACDLGEAEEVEGLPDDF